MSKQCIQCSCGDREHALLIERDPNDPDFPIMINIVVDGYAVSFFDRIKILFGKRMILEREILLTPKEAKKLTDALNEQEPTS